MSNLALEKMTFEEMSKERHENDTNINNMKVGDMVVCGIELGHDYIEYTMIVETLDKADFEEDDDGILWPVAFGVGATEEDEEFADEEAGHRIDGTNFVCIKRNNFG